MKVNSKLIPGRWQTFATCTLTLLSLQPEILAQRRDYDDDGWQTAPVLESHQLRERVRPAPTPRVAIAPLATPYRPMPAHTPKRMRGIRNALWVVADTLYTPQSIHQMVADAAEGGVDTLFVQVRSRGDALYFSSYEPRNEGLARSTDDYDPLATVIDEAHAKGIKVHAWLNTFVLWGRATRPASPNHIFNAHPDWIARDKNNQYAKTATTGLEGAYLQPSNPEVQDHLYRVFTEVARKYDVDGIHFDYCRYENSNYDYSTAALKRFRNTMRERLSMDEVVRIDNEERTNRLAWSSAFPKEWEAWRRAQVTNLVARISESVKRMRNISVSAAVYPDAQEAARYRGQEWEKWFNEGYLDMVALMAYSGDSARIGRVTANAVAAANGRTVLTGLGAYNHTPNELRGMIRTALESGATGIAFFAYNRQNATPETLKMLAREVSIEPRESRNQPEQDRDYGTIPRKPMEEEVSYIQPEEEKPTRVRRRYRKR